MEKIVKAGLRDCTVMLDGSECAVKFDTCFRAFAVRNDGAADIYISKSSGIVPDDDGVMCVKSGASAVFAHMDIYADTVYLLGTSKVQVHAQNDSANPFNFAPTFDGGVMASGNPVQIDGLQGGVPFSEMVVSGKNLLTYPYNETTKTVNGITFTDNGDGTITANGTATANATITLARNFGFENEGNYFLSGCPSGGGLNSFYINWYQNHTGVTQKNYNDYDSGIIIPYQHIFSENNSLAITIIAGTTVNNLVFRPQLELGDTATTYEPPIMGRELTVNASGKNIIAQPFFIEQQGGALENNGIAYTLNADKSITASGTATADSYCILQHLTMSLNVNRLKKNTDYFLSGSPVGSGADTYQIYAGIYDNDGNRIEIYHDYGSGALIRIANDYRCATSITIKKGQTVSNLIFRPQLELGDTATAYEPYHGGTTTITPDSNPYVITNDIRQQEGLNVVSVSEGELSVTGVRKNAAVKKIWDKIDELTTAIIVSNGETIE